jgi:hypothetical protein
MYRGRDVPYGSFADIGLGGEQVRFSIESGHGAVLGAMSAMCQSQTLFRLGTEHSRRRLPPRRVKQFLLKKEREVAPRIRVLSAFVQSFRCSKEVC